MKIKAAVVGGTGYAGQELLRILYRHPNVEVVSIGSHSYEGQAYNGIYGNFKEITSLDCENVNLEDLSHRADVIFLALPHGIASSQVTAAVLERSVVIDLGADFRLKDLDIYSKWYQVEHHGKELLEKAVYGLCELHREDIKKARLIANPGCYTTCSILSLAPLVKNHLIDPHSIIIDAKSGVTGAGRGLNTGNLYCECNESIKAYKVGAHRHTPEIEQELGLLSGETANLLFTPHLTPMNRGILAVCYANLTTDMDESNLHRLYANYYKDEYFVRVLPQNSLPETRWVKGSNYCDIGLKVDPRTGHVIVIGAIDNLMKGAAGQAVQNMNLVFGLLETTGIDFIADFPA